MKVSQTVSKCAKIPKFAIKSQRSRYENFSWMIWAGIHFHFRALFTYCMSIAVLFIYFVKWNITKNSIVSSELVKSNLWAIPCSSGREAWQECHRSTEAGHIKTQDDPTVSLTAQNNHLCVCSLCLSDTSNIIREKNEGKRQKRSIDERESVWKRESPRVSFCREIQWSPKSETTRASILHDSHFINDGSTGEDNN